MLSLFLFCAPQLECNILFKYPGTYENDEESTTFLFAPKAYDCIKKPFQNPIIVTYITDCFASEHLRPIIYNFKFHDLTVCLR